MLTINREKPAPITPITDATITDATITCRVDGLNCKALLEPFDKTSIFLSAEEPLFDDSKREVRLVLVFDEAEAFFKAGLELIEQERKRHGS